MLLNEIGFTRYESLVYLSLISCGISSARELSRNCGIPYGKVYEILNNLMSKGFILVSETRPMQFKPVEPSRVMNLLRKNACNKIKNAEKVLEKMEFPKNETSFFSQPRTARLFDF